MVKRWRKLGWGAILLALPATYVGAQGVGTTGVAFLKVGVGARPLAMGGAYAALADDANAINWNPGALTEVKQRNVTASYNSLFVDQNQGFVGFASPLSNGHGTFGAGFDYLTVGNIQKRAGDTENADATFSNDNFALIASYARTTPVDGLSLGVNLKYIRTVLDTFSANAMAFDGGLLYHTPLPNLTAGFTIQNLGSKIGPDDLPILFKGGAAYKLFDRRLAVASDFDWYARDQRSYADLGAEFWMNKNLAVRAGYQFGHGQDRLSSNFVGMGVGVGIKLDRFTMDYAFLPFGNLGDTHRITVGVGF